MSRIIECSARGKPKPKPTCPTLPRLPDMAGVWRLLPVWGLLSVRFYGNAEGLEGRPQDSNGHGALSSLPTIPTTARPYNAHSPTSVSLGPPLCVLTHVYALACMPPRGRGGVSSWEGWDGRRREGSRFQCPVCTCPVMWWFGLEWAPFIPLFLYLT